MSERERLTEKKLDLEVETLARKLPWPRGVGMLAQTVVVLAAGWGGLQYFQIQTALIELETLRVKEARRIQMRDSETIERLVEEIVNEPSGLTGLASTSWRGRRLFLAVDDDEQNIFVLRETSEEKIGLQGALSFPRDVGDLESIAACPNGNRSFTVYAVASHRELDRKKVTKILRAEITVDSLLASGARTLEAPQEHQIAEEIAYALKKKYSGGFVTIDSGGKSTESGYGGSDLTVSIDGKWWHEKDENGLHPFAVEIEGASCVEEKYLYLALKYPLTIDGRGILLRIELDDNNHFKLGHDGRAIVEVIDIELPKVSDEDRGGYTAEEYMPGITSLEYDARSKVFLMAITPSMKPGDDQARRQLAYSSSRLAAYSIGADGSLELCGSYALNGRKQGKLEGLAVVGSWLWMSYDAEGKGHFEASEMDDVRATLGRSCFR